MRILRTEALPLLPLQFFSHGAQTQWPALGCLESLGAVGVTGGVEPMRGSSSSFSKERKAYAAIVLRNVQGPQSLGSNSEIGELIRIKAPP